MKKMEKTLVPASRTGRRFFSGMAFLLLALVFVPLDCSELLYNKSTTKNFDFAVRSGAGVRAGHEFASGDELAVSLAGLSTIGKSDGNYWQVRLMGEWVMPSSLGWRTFVGIGVEYLAPYKGSSHLGGFYPVVSVGLSL